MEEKKDILEFNEESYIYNVKEGSSIYVGILNEW